MGLGAGVDSLVWVFLVFGAGIVNLGVGCIGFGAGFGKYDVESIVSSCFLDIIS